jgi:Mrp family chromosome partitioning ATPase
MGRILQALKQGETQRGALSANPSAHVAPNATEQEIPFIEWGPRRSMEASPSVLAAPAPAARGVSQARTSDETAVALVAPPSIVFRPLPAAKDAGKFAPELVAFHDPDSVLSSQYRELLKGLLAAHSADEPRIMLFTAAHPGGGTTTTLLNAAIAAARAGRRRIAVVDANLSHPAIAAALGLSEKPGLREVLAGAASFDEALQETAQADLTALTAGVTLPTGGVRFIAETVRSLWRQLRQRFDLIFVDAPAWDSKPETVNIAAICDDVYLVLSPAETDTPEIDELLRHLPEQGAKLAGCIITGR